MAKKYIRNGFAVLIGLIFMSISTYVFAQEPNQPDKKKVSSAGQVKRSHTTVSNEEVREMLQIMRIWKLTKVVELTEEQSLRLFPFLNQQDKIKEIARKDKDSGMEELKTLLKDETTANTTIQEKLDLIEKIDAEAQAKEDEIKNEIKQILSSEQLAQLEIFQKEFEDDVRDMILEIRSLKK